MTTTQLDYSHVMNTYARQPVCFVRGEGTQLWDIDGKRYLDFLGGLAVVALGHANPIVADAISLQAHTLVHVSNLYWNDKQPELARQLSELIGQSGKMFFGNSGAEANEAAIKLARRTGLDKHGPNCFNIVSAYGSFHGRTLATLAATGQPKKHERFQPMPPGFLHVNYSNTAAMEAALDDSVAAVMLETVQGEGGVKPADEAYLRAVEEMCRARDITLIIDEVQTGLGRTGTWFGFQRSGIAPDIVTMAKALGNGMPIGACWARDEIADHLQPGDHASTFGGQPLAVAAALAVLEELRQIDAPQIAEQRGAYLSAGLTTLEGIKSTRGYGLLLAAEIAGDATSVAQTCLELGLIVNPVTPTALRFAPPLTVSEAEIDEAIDILRRTLRQ